MDREALRRPEPRLLCNHMVTQFASTPNTFSAIADPTRRAILDLLRVGEFGAGEIAAHFPVSRPAVSRHLRVLREAGLVREQRLARSRRYALVADPLEDVSRWLDSYKVFWGARLLSLKQYVERGQTGPSARGS